MEFVELTGLTGPVHRKPGRQPRAQAVVREWACENCRNRQSTVRRNGKKFCHVCDPIGPYYWKGVARRRAQGLRRIRRLLRAIEPNGKLTGQKRLSILRVIAANLP